MADELSVIENQVRRALDKENYDEAETLCREALAEDPKCYPILIAYSVVLRMKGDLLASASSAEQAIRVNPGLVEGYYQLAVTSYASGHLGRAENALRVGIHIRPDVADLHLQMGLVLDGLDRPNEAKQAYAACLKLAPNNLQARLCLASNLLKEGEIVQSRALAASALHMSPKSPAAHLTMAEVLMTENHRELADALIHRATELDPKSGSAWLALGYRQTQAGDFVAAEASFLKSIQWDPQQGYAYLGLSRVKKFTLEDQALMDSMTAIAVQGSLPPSELSWLHFAQAKANEDMGRFDQAMHAFEEAHRLSASTLHGPRQFHADTYRSIIDKITELFSTDQAPLKLEFTNPSNTPIFIVGMIRSGTTLLEQILSSHPEVGAVGEQPFWEQKAGNLEKLQGLCDHPETARSLSDNYLNILQELAPGSQRITDKLPGNYLRIGLLNRVFPNAKFIHCRRAPLDTAWSIYTTPNRAGPSFSHSKEHIAFAYNQYVGLMEHWRNTVPPTALLDVSYEELIENPEPVIRQLVVFCGLEWDDACLMPEANSKEVWTPSVWQVRQPIYKTSRKKWKPYEAWLGALDQLKTEA